MATAQLEQKFFSFAVKHVDLEKSEFEGYSAGIGNRDLGNDIILPGAFKKTIKERVAGGQVKLLDQHMTHSTQSLWGTVLKANEERITGNKIGDPTAPSHKLRTTFSVSEADPNAQVALRKVGERHLDQLSIGYKAIIVEFEVDEADDPDVTSSRSEDPRWAWYMGNAVRKIKELAWWETSLVIWGMNPAATIIQNSLKTLTEFARHATLNQTHVLESDVKEVMAAMEALLQSPAAGDREEEIRAALRVVTDATEVVAETTGKATASVEDALTTLWLSAQEELGEDADKWATVVWIGGQMEKVNSPKKEVITIGPGGDFESLAEAEAAQKETLVETESSTEEENLLSSDSEEGDSDPVQEALGNLRGALNALSEAVGEPEPVEEAASDEDDTPGQEPSLEDESEEPHGEVEEAASDTEPEDEDGHQEHFPTDEELEDALQLVGALGAMIDSE